MQNSFLPHCRCLLIGSLPVTDHEKAGELVMTYSPDIPVWVQLPVNKVEGMIPQFLPGMPGVVTVNGKTYIDTTTDAFEKELVAFYEQYLSVSEDSAGIDTSVFALSRDVAAGFYTFVRNIEKLNKLPVALKGQITGPFTFTTGMADQDKRAIFYNEQLRDAAVKLLSLKAAWQLKKLARFEAPKIIFIDEPALTGFGSSEFTSISAQAVAACLEEVISVIHSAGGIAGIHVCGNTDWSLVLGTTVDIVNFDAYAYFDRFVLYEDAIRKFIGRGGLLAWGIVPTLLAENIDRESVDSLTEKLKFQMKALTRLGIPEQTVYAQSLISPSCGAGSLDADRAIKVLKLNQGVSQNIRKGL